MKESGVRNQENTAAAAEEHSMAPQYLRAEWRIASLTNILLPYRVVLMQAFAARVAEMRIFLSARTEPDRRDEIAWPGLDVVVQRSTGFTHRFRHVHAYNDMAHIHIPYDTLLQLHRYRPDIVISNEFGARTVFGTLFCLLHPRTTLIVWATISQRTEATRGVARRLLRRLLLSKADAVFGNGQDTEDYIRSLGFRGRIFHIPYVVDNDKFSGVSQVYADSVRRLLFSGQLIERKGIEPFFAALCIWCQAHSDVQIELSIAGDGPLRSKLESIASPLNLSTCFLGYLSQAQLAAAYHRAAICAFPTLADEWGVVVNEALCAGVPVLGSIHSQAVAELVREGSSGWLFDPTDKASIDSALTRALLTSVDELRRMASNARESISAVTPDRIAERMISALVEVRRRT